MQLFIIAVGLGAACWGHLLTHDLLGAKTAWRSVDDLFPPVLRSSATFAGRTMLIVGSLLVLVPILG